MIRVVLKFMFVGITSLMPLLALSQANPLFSENKPELGKLLPPFSLNDITHFKIKEATLDDFKGQWLFMDFWFLGCTNCIKSFPKINLLQKHFWGKVQFLLVGTNDRKFNSDIKVVYEKFRQKQELNI